MRSLAIPIVRPSYLPMALAVAFLASLVLFPAWTVDDAYITLRYAHNLVEHGVLGWNVGEPPVEGYTGILWPLLAAAAMVLRLDPLLVLKSISLISTVWVLLFSNAILWQLRIDLPQRRLALALLAVGPWWAVHAQSGLETSLFTALLLLSIYAWLRNARTTPLWCLLAALCRPEGVLLGLLLPATNPDQFNDHESSWLVYFVLPGAAYMFLRIGYYGDLLPNTFYAKSGSGVSSWSHLAAFASTAVLLPALAWWQSRPDFSRLASNAPLVAGLGIFIGVLCVVYGSSELLMNYAHRFFVPILPLLIIGLAASWGQVRLSGYLVGYAGLSMMLLFMNGLYCWNYQQMEQTEHAPAAVWIRQHMPADATLMVIVDAGLVPYQTGLRTIDVGALNDRYLAAERDPAKRLDYLFGQRPDVVLLATGELGIVAGEQTRAALLADPRWRDNYQLATEFRGEQRFSYHQQIWVRRSSWPMYLQKPSGR